jgi:hypothetical protein
MSSDTGVLLRGAAGAIRNAAGWLSAARNDVAAIEGRKR